jgi:hypothetical protein
LVEISCGSPVDIVVKLERCWPLSTFWWNRCGKLMKRSDRLAFVGGVFALPKNMDSFTIDLLIDIVGIVERYDRLGRDAGGEIVLVKANNSKIEDLDAKDSIPSLERDRRRRDGRGRPCCRAG